VTTEEITDLNFGSPDRNPDQLEGLRVLVVGLGRHGGGTELVRFLADRGAVVSITDPADHDQLQSSIDLVADLPLHRVRIGEPHQRQDLLDCDWVVVNPAIPPGTSTCSDGTGVDPRLVATAAPRSSHRNPWEKHHLPARLRDAALLRA